MLEEFLAGKCVIHIHSNESGNRLMSFDEPGQSWCSPYKGDEYKRFPYVAREPISHFANGFESTDALPGEFASAPIYEDDEFFAELDAESKIGSRIDSASLDSVW